MASTYSFKPHERPMLPGSPYNPDHPQSRMWAYGLIGALAAITGGLGNALVTANLAFFQGTLGLSSTQAAAIPAAYVATNVCANLVLVKFRQQFGLALFIRLMLVGYALTALLHLFVHDFWSALLVRAASGIAGAGLTTLAVLAMMQSMPAAKRPFGVLLGISIPQLSIPLARVIAPELLEWGDWRMTYYLEFGLALLTFASILWLPLPPSDRSKVFERWDLVAIGLLVPGISLLCFVLALGRTLWWFASPTIGLALAGAVILIGAALMVEHGRKNPLLTTRWLGERAILRIGFIAISVRILLSEQSFGAIGLLTTLGMGVDQFQMLFLIVTLASIAGIAAAYYTFNPVAPGRGIQVACLLIAVGALMDAQATNLTRPANLYISQALVGFGALLFVGPAMLIGISRTLLAGPQNFISWIILFSATQNFGGLMGSAFFGTFQTIREKFHSHELVQQVVATNPLVASRLGGGGVAVGGVVTDPTLRTAEGSAILSAQVSREAYILAYNDVFMVIVVLAAAMLLWGIYIELSMRWRGETSPIVLLGQRMAAAAAEQASQEGRKS